MRVFSWPGWNSPIAKCFIFKVELVIETERSREDGETPRAIVSLPSNQPTNMCLAACPCIHPNIFEKESKRERKDTRREQRKE